MRPDLGFAVGYVLAGVDSEALEYRVGDWLHGIEFMTLDATAGFRSATTCCHPVKALKFRA
jgi:hypothetical protein